MSEVINELFELIKDCDVETGCYRVDGYFNATVWSLEKEEWDKMSFIDKVKFVARLIHD